MESITSKSITSNSTRRVTKKELIEAINRTFPQRMML